LDTSKDIQQREPLLLVAGTMNTLVL